jgi:hypothetical protein
VCEMIARQVSLSRCDARGAIAAAGLLLSLLAPNHPLISGGSIANSDLPQIDRVRVLAQHLFVIRFNYSSSTPSDIKNSPIDAPEQVAEQIIEAWKDSPKLPKTSVNLMTVEQLMDSLPTIDGALPCRRIPACDVVEVIGGPDASRGADEMRLSLQITSPRRPPPHPDWAPPRLRTAQSFERDYPCGMRVIAASVMRCVRKYREDLVSALTAHLIAHEQSRP